MNNSPHLPQFDSAELLPLAQALKHKWPLDQEVIALLQELDGLIAQRARELQSAQQRLNEETAVQTKLEAQLRQAQKMEAVGQLAAGVAHDFNNILTVAQGNASLLLADKSPDSPDCRPLQNICSAADRGAALVGQLLTFCRQQVVSLRPTHLRETLAALEERMPRVLTPMIKLDAHATPGLPLIQADGPMMETLLMNLAANARDAMAEGGILCITAAPISLSASDASGNPEARAGSFVRLSVSDTGAGIAPEILPRIFEPFFTTKPVGQGSGLGLSTVYGIVKQHNGWVEVQSKVSRGTAFHIYLPALAAAEAPPAAPAAPKPAKAPGGRETIFVVDDEPDLRELVSQVLEGAGYKVISAGSGAEALEQWARRQCEIHLLLTDIVMPDGFTGRKLADQLQGEEPQLRVIYTSGYTHGMPGTETANMDERCFLAKPYRPSTLLKVVRECLDRPRPNAASAQQAA